MRLLPLALVLVAACGEPAPSQELGFPAYDSQLPPPTLAVGPLLDGTPLVLSAAGLPPGGRVYLIASPAGLTAPGAGACPSILLGSCLSLASPAFPLGSGLVASNGTVVIAAPIPNPVPAEVVHLQAALVFGGRVLLSPPFSRVRNDADLDGIPDGDTDPDTFDTSFVRTDYFELQSARWFVVAGIGADGGLSNFVADTTAGSRAEFPSELTYILQDGADRCFVAWSLPEPLASVDTDTDAGPVDTDTDGGPTPSIPPDLQVWLDDRLLSHGFQLDLTTYEAEPVVDDANVPCEFDPAVFPAGFDFHETLLRDDLGVPVTSMNVGITTTPLVDVTFNGTPNPPQDHWYNSVLQNPGTLQFTSAQGVVTQTRDYPMAGFAYRLDSAMGTLPAGSPAQFLARSEMGAGSALAPGLHIVQGVISIGY